VIDKVKARALIGMIMLDFPTGYAEKPETYVEKGFSMRKKFLNHPLIKLILHEMN
jgi:5-methylthioadenosine/S-adenosylhomocysteine deaminase